MLLQDRRYHKCSGHDLKIKMDLDMMIKAKDIPMKKEGVTMGQVCSKPVEIGIINKEQYDAICWAFRELELRLIDKNVGEIDKIWNEFLVIATTEMVKIKIDADEKFNQYSIEHAKAKDEKEETN